MKAIQLFFSKFKLIFIALLMGQVLFLSVTVFLTIGVSNTSEQTKGDLFLFIVPIVQVFGMLTGAILSKQRIVHLQKIKDLQTRLKGYEQISIIRYALLEGPNLFAIVAFLLTQNWILFGIALLGILAFISLFPTKARLFRELAISDEELLKMN